VNREGAEVTSAGIQERPKHERQRQRKHDVQ